MKSKVGIADAFGTLVEVGDTVVYKGKQSTMHKITRMDLRLDMFTDDTPQNAYDAVVVEQMAYQQDPSEENFRALKAAVPEGLMLTARISTNYQQLRTIFTQRCHHELHEWQEFCEWIRKLPYGKQLITGEVNK